MFRTVVTFLVAVPLLMPPGMCICQFAPTGKAFAATRPEADRHPHVAPASDSRSDCRCDSCRERATDAGLTAGSEGRSSHDGSLPSGPGKHAPGCPAALGDMPTKVAAPAVSIHFDVTPGLCFDSPVGQPAASVGRNRECVSAPAASSPLFICHCSLQI